MDADPVFKTLTKLNREYELGVTIRDMVTACYCASYNEEDFDKLKAVACLMGLEVVIHSQKVNSTTLGCLIDTQKIHSTGARLNRW